MYERKLETSARGSQDSRVIRLALIDNRASGANPSLTIFGQAH